MRNNASHALHLQQTMSCMSYNLVGSHYSLWQLASLRAFLCFMCISQFSLCFDHPAVMIPALHLIPWITLPEIFFPSFLGGQNCRVWGSKLQSLGVKTVESGGQNCRVWGSKLQSLGVKTAQREGQNWGAISYSSATCSPKTMVPQPFVKRASMKQRKMMT